MIQLRILDILKEQGHSKYWLWKQTGMSYQNFNKVVSNETESIRFDTIEKLFLGLGCPIGELFEIIPDNDEEKEYKKMINE